MIGIPYISRPLTAAAIAARLITTAYTPPDNLFSITGSANTNRILAFEVDTQAAGTLTLDVGAQTASRRLTVQTMAADSWAALAGQVAFVSTRVPFSDANGRLTDSANTLAWASGCLVVATDPGGSETLRVGGNIRANGTDYNLGAGGAGSNNATITLNGSSASSFGAQLRLQRAAVLKGTLGNYGGIFGGASDDITLYAVSGVQIRLDVNGTDNLVCGATGNTLAGIQTTTSTTDASAIGTASVVMAGGLSVAKQCWVGDHLVFNRATGTIMSYNSSTNDRFVQLSGGSSGGAGANFLCYGGAHATNANQLIVRTDGTARLTMSSAGDFSFSSTTAATTVAVGSITTAGGIGVAKGINVGAVSSITDTGAGLRSVLNLNNLQAAGAGVGCYLQFQGDSAVAPMAAVAASFPAASNADANLDFYTRGGGTQSFRARVTSTGHLLVGGTSDNGCVSIQHGTITAALPTLDASVIWNSGATVFTGWKFNATDTASSGSSLLLDLQVGGSTKTRVDKAGGLLTYGYLQTNWSPTVASGASYACYVNPTWNDGANVLGALYVNATDTSSGAASMLIRADIGGATQRFGVRKDGQTSITAVTSATASSDDLFLITNNSSGTPAAGYGANLRINLKSSTTIAQTSFAIQSSWTVATHASRTARAGFYVSDSAAERLALTLEANGTAPMIGFLGASPVARVTFAAWTGTATRTSFATGAATLVNVAEAVKAIIDDLRTFGLYG